MNNNDKFLRLRGEREEQVEQSNQVMETELRRLMQEHGAYLKRLCFLYLKDESLAEDAVSETFLKLYRALPDFRGESSEKTWISRIAINTCRDFRRAAWYKLVDLSAALERIQSLQDELSLRDDTVISAVMALPRKYKEPVLLRYYQNLSLKEVGEALNLSVSTTSTRLIRARNMLKNKLKGWYFNEE
ncbi:MAG: sigma-70 family RNA polymerase sigma factor [Clostridiales bacterium]|nr:sigma-70 family RNA polymerase sigma factor [Clostridiales bacterium]